MVPLFSDGKTKSGSIYLQIGMFTKRDIILPPIIQAPLMDLFPSRPFYGKMEGTILLYVHYIYIYIDYFRARTKSDEYVFGGVRLVCGDASR